MIGLMLAAAVAAPSAPLVFTPPVPPGEVVLHLTPQELQVIAQALADQPYKLASPVFEKLRAELAQQPVPPAPVPKAAK